MSFAGGGSPDEQGDVETQVLHFLCVVNHFVERGRNESAQTKNAGSVFTNGLQNLVTAYHDSKIDYFPIVAGEHDPDDVLSNVMDASLDRCDHHGPLLVCALEPSFSASMKGSR